MSGILKGITHIKVDDVVIYDRDTKSDIKDIVNKLNKLGIVCWEENGILRYAKEDSYVATNEAR
jgi:hypothetical protein